MPESDTLLFELFTEEIPSFYQIRVIEDWKLKIPTLLQENLFEFSDIETGGTSRRIYVLINKLKPLQSTEKKKIKGPAHEICIQNGKPTGALIGFSKKANVSPDEVKFETENGKSYAVAEVTIGGKKIDEILPIIFETLIKTQAFERSMRWADLSITYARPIIQYFLRYGHRTIKFTSGIWDIIKAGENIHGHFILGPQVIPIKEASEYPAELEKHGITVNDIDRRNNIERSLRDSADAAGNKTLIFNSKLLDEVNFLVEKPVVIKGSFPHEFLIMPEIVILSEMQEHQKYFGLRNTDGTLSNEFLIVASADVNDLEALANIRHGNEKVLRARISDGLFFFTEDRKKALIDRVDDLKRIVFHEAMGSVFEKKERIKKIAGCLKPYIDPGLDDFRLERACDLIKADLTTHLVYEFDHLQGEIGSIYAKMDGEDPDVASAIFEHYLPRNNNDEFPKAAMGILLSISDKLDNIISGHILGKQPTASQDPLGLRRQTLYIIDMFIENKIEASLRQIFTDIFTQNIYNIGEVQKKVALTQEIVTFFKGRMATTFGKEDFDKKFINAILGTENEKISELFLIVDVLREFKDDERFLAVVDGFKRMNNIVKDFLQKNNDAIMNVNENYFELEQEKKLYSIIDQFNKKRLALSGKSREQYEGIFNYLASIKPDIDNFFDKVMVMHEKKEIKMNRLAILNQAVQYVKILINIEMLQ